MKKRYIIKTLALLGILFSLFFLNNSFDYLDPDLGWHLKVGEDIVQDQMISTVNYYNYTLNNIEWLNHEWLLDALSYLIYNNFGYISLSIIFAFLTTLVFYLLYKYLNLKYQGLKNKENISFSLSFFLYSVISLFGIIAISPHVGVRMQVVALLLFVLLLIILEKYKQKEKFKYIILLPLLFLFWANTHGTFILGLGLMFSFLGTKIIERYLYYYNVKKIDYSYLWSNKKIFIFFNVSLASSLVTLINPYSFKLYNFLNGYTNTFYLKHIQEWLPQYMLPINMWQISYLAISLSLVFVVWFLNKYKDIKLNLWDLFLFLFFLYFAISSKRHFPLFFIASAPVIIYLINQIFINERKFFTYSYLNKYINIDHINRFTLFMYFLVLIALTSQINFTNTPFSSYCNKYPCEAVEYIKNSEAIEGKRIFNNYSWGGYMIWKMPEKQIFIDGRMPQLAYKDQTILEEYFDFFEEDKGENQLNEYNIEVILLPNINNEGKASWFERKVLKLNYKEKNNYLYNYLESSENWEKVFVNNLSIIYNKIK